MKEYAELPTDQKPDHCPLDKKDQEVFLGHYRNLMSQCPAFEQHKCPFDHVKTVDDIHGIVQHINSQKIRECPAFDEKHGDLMSMLRNDLTK